MKLVYKVYDTEYNQGDYFVKEFWDKDEAYEFAQKRQEKLRRGWWCYVDEDDVDDDYELYKDK